VPAFLLSFSPFSFGKSFYGKGAKERSKQQIFKLLMLKK
jgi:hypothetical protein